MPNGSCRERPFLMGIETPMQKYRAETFWTKEPETIAWIESFQPDDVYYDIGANIGVYALYAATLYPEMRIYAFEPVRANFMQLHRNKKDNEIGNWFSAMRYAIGDRVGPCFLDVPDTEIGSSGAQALNFRDCNLMNAQEVQMETIDNLQRVIVPPTQVKIDIDGQELAVLRGMQKTLPKVKSVLIEVSRSSFVPVFELMLNSGFTFDSPLNTMKPHSRDRRKMEGIDAENLIFVRK